MAKKPGRILTRSEITRDPREPVVLAGTCRIGDRPAEEVLVIDLGTTGCCVRGSFLGVTKSEPLALTLAGFGPYPGKLKWARKGSLGVEFDLPLDPLVLDELYATGGPEANVVPLRRHR